MIPVIMIATGVVIGIGLVAVFWQKIHEYMQKLVDKLKQIIEGNLLGVKIFLRHCADGFQQITKTYSQNKENKKWEEGIVKRMLKENEVPEKIKNDLEKRNMMSDEFGVDMTDDYQQQLQL